MLAGRAQFRGVLAAPEIPSLFPGTIWLEVLDPIPPGLDRESFAARLQNDIEAATARLIAQGERQLRA